MLTLYQFEGSPYSWKVRIALTEKGLPFQAVTPQNRDANPEFRRLSPTGKVPVLVTEEGTAIVESTIINEYLDERYPERPLLPANPAARAQARMVEEIADQYLAPALRMMLLSRARMEAGRWHRRSDPSPAQEAEGLRTATPYLDHLDRLARGREYFQNVFGMADIGLIPVLGRTGRALELPLAARWSGLHAWLTRCLARPSVTKTAPPPLQFV